ncbi:MAG: phosphoglucosamine mutase [Methanobacterium sp.]|jgi:phosphoglucosamine mutase
MNSNENNSEAPKLFGTSGIRGKVDSEVTLELALGIGRSLSTLLGEGHRIVVGYDSRTSNKMLESALTAGILEGGCNVLSLGLAPTPLVGYATMKIRADAGVMITASHNPPQDNGIKVWNRNGMAYRAHQERALEKVIHYKTFTNTSWENIGRVEDISSLSSLYITDLLNFINIKPGLKVVVDCANGAASYMSPLLLRKAGCDVITLNSQPDGFFPGRMPEPSDKNLGELKKMVKKSKADLGIAHDGDADRMVAVDEKGVMAEFDKLLSLVASEIGGRVVTTVDASSTIDLCMDKIDGQVIRTEVGDVHVAEAIEEHKASFGGEPSGTWIHPDFCMCPDGLLSALRVIELVQKKGPLSQLLKNVPSFPTLRERIDCKEDQKNLVMEKVKKKLPHLFESVIKVDLIDGVRISMKNGNWILIRPSGTEPYLRITLGGKTIEEAQKMMERCKGFLGGLM